MGLPMLKRAQVSQTDSDGIPDYLEDNTKDTDSDGLPDALDPDSGGGTDEFGGGIVFADYGEEPDGDPTGLQPTGLSTVGNKRYRLETGECGTPDFVSQRPSKVNPYAPEGDFFVARHSWSGSAAGKL